MKKTVLLSWAGMLLSGCGPTSSEYQSPAVDLIQNPKLAYQLNFKLHEVPGPVSKIKAIAFYEVKQGCVKPLPFSGAVVRPSHHLTLPVKQIGDGQYQAVFHKDAIRDEDYFGFGLCQWEFQNIVVHFSSPTTDFIASYSIPEAQAKPAEAEEYVFLNKDYFQDPGIISHVFGEKAGFYQPKMGPQFRLTISAEKL